MKVKDLFLPRTLIYGHYLVLCTTEKMFHDLLNYIEYPKGSWPKWVNTGANATTHTVDHDGKTVCIVCIAEPPKNITNIQIAAMLVHEAVHVWQRNMESIGEDNPSVEFEAYSIQIIAQNLMEAYVEQKMGKLK